MRAPGSLAPRTAEGWRRLHQLLLCPPFSSSTGSQPQEENRREEEVEKAGRFLVLHLQNCLVRMGGVELGTCVP